jgi:hypothetical protein
MKCWTMYTHPNNNACYILFLRPELLTFFYREACFVFLPYVMVYAYRFESCLILIIGNTAVF